MTQHEPAEQPSGHKAVVWDLDGVIVDSGEAHNYSWQAMAAEFGVPYSGERDFKGIFGRHNSDIINSLWSVTDNVEVNRMAARKEAIFREAARELKPLPGVVELVQALHEAGWKQGIGSSAPLDNIKLLLEATGVEPYIAAIASGEDVERGKPDPAVFLIAFSRLGVDPDRGVVIEDAPTGVQAGNSAGAATLGVTTTQTADTLREAGADLVVGSLEEVSVATLEQLLRAHVGKRKT